MDSQRGRVMLTRIKTARLERSASLRHWYRSSPSSRRIFRARLESSTEARVSRVKSIKAAEMTPATII
mgnify:CR=1 FL=1